MVSDAQLLDEQAAYYRAIADEYEQHFIDAPGGAQLSAAFDGFAIGGDVLELACGPGQWTERLVRRADSVTAVDASPQMLRRARSRPGVEQVRFVEADLFSWVPDRCYDSVFFGFWLSHVPTDHFESFWALIANCLKSNGNVFFVDDNFRPPEELIEGPDSSTIERRLNDGTRFRAIKVPHQAEPLQRRLGALGWDISVSSAGPFYWGSGRRSTD